MVLGQEEASAFALTVLLLPYGAEVNIMKHEQNHTCMQNRGHQFRVNKGIHTWCCFFPMCRLGNTL